LRKRRIQEEEESKILYIKFSEIEFYCLSYTSFKLSYVFLAEPWYRGLGAGSERVQAKLRTITPEEFAGCVARNSKKQINMERLCLFSLSNRSGQLGD
jgi:hypothetical protein